MGETRLVQHIIKNLKQRGGFWVKIHGGAFQRMGLPDIIGCAKGRFVAFEVKLPGKENTLTDMQKFILKEITKAGGIAQMVTSIEEAVQILEDSVYRI